MIPPSILHLSTEKFTLTRVSHTHPDLNEIINIPCEEAFLVIIQLRDFTDHRLWRGRRLSYAGGYLKGCVSLPYLGDELRCQHRAAYDNLRFNIPRSTLDELQIETGGKPVSDFKYEQGTQDPVIYHLAQAMLPALQHPATANRLFIDHILLALCAHTTRSYGQFRSGSEKGCTRLSPAQERLAKELIASHLGDDLSVSRIAQECALSRSHFSRAFKQTTGVAPHTWLLQMRVERAKALLLATPLTGLSRIAQECGFADQPHFTRVFTRLIGVTPSVWRRQAKG